MKLIGAVITTGALALGAYIAWRIVAGVESWLTTSGAADVLMWAVVLALVLAVFALPAALWGIAARAWVVRLEPGQRIEGTAHALLPARHAAPALPEPVTVAVLPETIDA